MADAGSGSLLLDRQDMAGRSVLVTGGTSGIGRSVVAALEQGIRVTLIEPGNVATDMVEMSAAEKEQAIAELKMLRPEDIAAAVLFTLRQPEHCDIVSLQVRPHRQVI